MKNVRKKSCLIAVAICLLFSPGVWANSLLLTSIFNKTGKTLTVTINGTDHIVVAGSYLPFGVTKPVLADIPPGHGVETHGSIKITGAGLAQYSATLTYKYEGGGFNQYWAVDTPDSTAINDCLLTGKAGARITINLDNGQPVPKFTAEDHFC